MPDLVRLYIRHCLIGFALAVVFVAALIGFDVAGLRHLVLETQGGLLAGGVMVVLHGLVFAGVQFAIAVMAMAEDRPAPPSLGLRQVLTALKPVPVPVRRDPRDRG
jgi:hypothetical protein